MHWILITLLSLLLISTSCGMFDNPFNLPPWPTTLAIDPVENEQTEADQPVTDARDEDEDEAMDPIA
jgi:hypothetical protein